MTWIHHRSAPLTPLLIFKNLYTVKFTPYGKSHVSATSGQFNHPKMFPLFSPHSPTLLPDQGHFEGLVFITLKLLRWVTTGVQENRKIWFLLSGCPLEAEWEACNNSQKKQKKVRNLQLDLCLFHMPYYTCLSSKWLELHGFFFSCFLFSEKPWRWEVYSCGLVGRKSLHIKEHDLIT